MGVTIRALARSKIGSFGHGTSSRLPRLKPPHVISLARRKPEEGKPHMMERRNVFDYSRGLVARFWVSLAIVSTCSLLAAQPEEDPRAQYNRGTEYWYGSGVPQDYVEAAKWFRKAAEGGFAEAQYRLPQKAAPRKGN